MPSAVMTEVIPPTRKAHNIALKVSFSYMSKLLIHEIMIIPIIAERMILKYRKLIN